MTKLTCDVKTCTSNTCGQCSRPDIHVGGNSANTPSDTDCDSFNELRSGTTNAVGDREPNPQMPISCDAVNCKYNNNYECDADAIQVTGASAKQTSQTECETFKMK